MTARISIESSQLHSMIELLQGLQDKTTQLEPVMEDIGEYLLLAHQERNAKAIAPDGTPWAPLSTTTQTLKPRHQTAPLRLNDILLNQLIYQADDSGLEFGSNMIYAAMQHFGGTTSPKSMIPNKTLPAREFIGVSLEDENVILDILQNYLVS
jgi:phage virion morphogenesis protein